MKSNGKKSTTLSIRKYLAAITIGLGLSTSLSASYTVETVAGSAGVAADTDGTGSSARFSSPQMLTVDPLGNLYTPDVNYSVAWNYQYAIRKTTTSGDSYSVSTPFYIGHGLAYPGSTVALYKNSLILFADTYGSIVTANLDGSNQQHLRNGDGQDVVNFVVDASNNIYFTNNSSNYIGKITSSGATSIFVSGLSSPQGIAIDASGTFYVACDDNTIKKITPSGTVTTIAGTAGSSGSSDGISSAARFNSPIGIAADAAGNLYVADRGNNLIRKLTNNGGTYTVSTIAGTAGSSGSSDGVGSAALFNAPTGIAVDAFGYVFVTDTNNDTIRRLLPPSINIEVDGTDSATVSGPITNHARKTGTGTIVVSGDNSSLLNTSINQGLTKISSTNHMGKSLTLNGGDMEITSGTVAIPTADLRSAATVTTDASAAVSSVAAPYGSALLTFAGAGIVTAGDMSTSSTPVSIPGIMHVGASSSSKLTTGATTVPSGGLLKIMGATASSIPGDAEVQSGGVLEVDTGVNVPADTGADIFGTLQINDGATLKLGPNATWGRNITVGTAL